MTPETSSRRAFATIGLTGGIASGKSTVASRLRELGVEVIDADQLAREVVTVGSDCLTAICERFGAAMILSDGTLDRTRLAELVFSDPEALAALNRITHPAILRRADEAISKAREAGLSYVVYEAALILEAGLAPQLNALVVVLCNPESQCQRVMSRDGLSRRAAEERLSAQTDNAARRDVADWIIDNQGTLVDLVLATDRLFNTLTRRFGNSRGSQTSLE
jgi:dephospho-CoA kinase